MYKMRGKLLFRRGDISMAHCVSHRERWEVEKELYSITTTSENEMKVRWILLVRSYNHKSWMLSTHGNDVQYKKYIFIP